MKAWLKSRRPHQIIDPSARVMLALVALITGLSYTVGPHRWRNPSLTSGALKILHVPVWIYGIAMLLAFVLILLPDPLYRFTGYIVGGVVASSFAIFMLFHFRWEQGTPSPYLIVVTVLAAFFYGHQAYAIHELLRPPGWQKTDDDYEHTPYD